MHNAKWRKVCQHETNILQSQCLSVVRQEQKEKYKQEKYKQESPQQISR